MDYMERRDGKGVRHARSGERFMGVYRESWCGWMPSLDVKLVTGACIAPLIDCERCKRIMRKDGWSV